jgi:hypothetical protein
MAIWSQRDLVVVRDALWIEAHLSGALASPAELARIEERALDVALVHAYRYGRRDEEHAQHLREELLPRARAGVAAARGGRVAYEADYVARLERSLTGAERGARFYGRLAEKLCAHGLPPGVLLSQRASSRT